MKLRLGFSSCPNDTFIFDALIHQKIDTEGIEFVPIIEDVEQLNIRANQADLDITKLSYHAFLYLLDKYKLLNAGSALGFGVGPLLIAKNDFVIDDSFAEKMVGIPGNLTTANLLLSIAFPNLKRKEKMLFSSIEGALLDSSIDLGLIIHENRFTYQEKGLKKIADLGEFWEQEYKQAIPLGGIVVNRKLDNLVQQKVDRLIKSSIEFAFANPQSSLEFVKLHSQEMSEEVMYKHIDLYVNKYSVNLGEVGKSAVMKMMQLAVDRGLIEGYPNDFIVNQA